MRNSFELGMPRPPRSVDEVRSGDPWEFSKGQAIYCLPTGKPGARGTTLGAQVLESDPDVAAVGVDAGFKPDGLTLRAPDVAIIPDSDETGFIKGVPPLALEYADRGQDEQDLREKIDDFLSRGTRYIWVVRLVGPLRVEVHEPGKPIRLVTSGGMLSAPGILRNPIPVEALFNKDVANHVTLRNLLQREGYDSLEQVYHKGQLEGKIEGKLEGKIEGKIEGKLEGTEAATTAALEVSRKALLAVLEGRGISYTRAQQEQISRCQSLELLARWTTQVALMSASALLVLEGSSEVS